MDKPLTIQIEETKQAIIDAVNSSGLHPFILDAILKDIYNEMHILCQRQAAQDKKQYEQSKKPQNHSEPTA